MSWSGEYLSHPRITRNAPTISTVKSQLNNVSAVFLFTKQILNNTFSLARYLCVFNSTTINEFDLISPRRIGYDRFSPNCLWKSRYKCLIAPLSNFTQIKMAAACFRLAAARSCNHNNNTRWRNIIQKWKFAKVLIYACMFPIRTLEFVKTYGCKKVHSGILTIWFASSAITAISSHSIIYVHFVSNLLKFCVFTIIGKLFKCPNAVD